MKRVPPATPQRRRGVVAFLLLSSTGLAIAIALTVVHVRARTGAGPSFCSLGSALDCDRVALSPYSVFIGVPVAAWGAVAYGAMTLLAAAGLRRRRVVASWPSGILLLLSATAAFATIPLAVVSAVKIGSLCLLCAATWVIDWALLGIALRESSRAGGAMDAIRADIRVVAGRPRATLLAGASATVVAAALVGLSSPASAPAPPIPQGSPAMPDAGAPPATFTIVEFSDYACPYCARAHAELRAAVARRPGVQLEHRNFPLDQACNPIVRQSVHPGACALARASICAGDQGRFWEMNDLLYANQSDRRPVGELAAVAGLDPVAFSRCMDASRTAERVAGDVAAGIRAGVAATPTYLVGDQRYTGRLPPAVLAPSAARESTGPAR